MRFACPHCFRVVLPGTFLILLGVAFIKKTKGGCTDRKLFRHRGFRLPGRSAPFCPSRIWRHFSAPTRLATLFPRLRESFSQAQEGFCFLNMGTGEGWFSAHMRRGCGSSGARPKAKIMEPKNAFPLPPAVLCP